ncbi:MAG: hypothetical protein WC726_00870 [Parcubacteria group bacterium]|jgi:hypothetical protein
MEKSKSKESSLFKIGLYFFGCFIGFFALGVILYGWNDMFLFWPPEHPKGRGLLWGLSFGGLVGLVMLLIAMLAGSYASRKIRKTHN